MICERCGRSSKDPTICFYCKMKTRGDDGEPASVRDSGAWGWAEISIAAVPSSDRSRAVAAIQKGWEGIEHFTVLRLLSSQASALEFEVPTAKVLVRRDLLTSLVDQARRVVAAISVTFAPVDRPVATADEANMIITLEKSNLVELKELQQVIARELKNRELADRLKARAKILAIAKHVGVPIGELIGNAGEKQQADKTPTVPAHYRNHAHSKVT